MRIGWEMRKAVQNSLFWERFRAERVIEVEGGVCEAFVGDVSCADDVATRVAGCIAAFGPDWG
jgi:hypothetical protein